MANSTAESLLMVVESATQVTGIVDKIAWAANQQTVSVKQVTLAIDQISNVVQTNSATAEEGSAASQKLSGQAEMLKELVAQFTLENENAAETKAVSNAAAPHIYKPALTQYPETAASYNADKY